MTPGTSCQLYTTLNALRHPWLMREKVGATPAPRSPTATAFVWNMATRASGCWPAFPRRMYFLRDAGESLLSSSSMMVSGGAFTEQRVSQSVKEETRNAP